MQNFNGYQFFFPNATKIWFFLFCFCILRAHLPVILYSGKGKTANIFHNCSRIACFLLYIYQLWAKNQNEFQRDYATRLNRIVHLKKVDIEIKVLLSRYEFKKTFLEDNKKITKKLEKCEDVFAKFWRNFQRVLTELLEYVEFCRKVVLNFKTNSVEYKEWLERNMENSTKFLRKICGNTEKISETNFGKLFTNFAKKLPKVKKNFAEMLSKILITFGNFE